MRKSSLEKLDLELYEETLPNGLRIYVVPKENVNGIYATFSTKFGSIETEFNNDADNQKNGVTFDKATADQVATFVKKDETSQLYKDFN